MRWLWATRRNADGSIERRCGRAAHKGKRWLPLDERHFYRRTTEGGFSHWCKACQNADSMERYRSAHPQWQPRRASPRRKPSLHALERATASWGLRR